MLVYTPVFGSAPPVSMLLTEELLFRHLDRAGEPDTEAGLITAMTDKRFDIFTNYTTGTKPSVTQV